MDIKIEGLDGFDKLISDLETLGERSKELEGERKVALPELFTSKFIKENTSFDDQDKFFDSLPDPDETDVEELDEFVSRNSSFNTWQELLNASATDYYGRRLYEGLFD